MRCVVIPEAAPDATKRSFAQILGVHAALLHTGKILYFGGDEHDPGRHHLHMFDHSRLFDCQTLAISSPAASATIKDLFCCGHALLADGRVLVAGGTEEWTIDHVGGGDPHGHAGARHFRGNAEAYVFDPAAQEWVQVQRMIYEPGHTSGGGRWYPTLSTLGSGHVVALSGHPNDADTRHFNNSIEAFDPHPSPNGAWDALGTLPPNPGGYPDLTYYPRVHLLPDGSLFFASPLYGQSVKWNPSTLGFAVVGAGPGNDYDGIGSTSVLLPLLPEDAYRVRVLMAGNVQPKRIDLSATSPAWQPAGTRTLLTAGAPPVRVHNNGVILPTGDVAIVGGLRNPADDPGSAVRDIEIYRPATNSWVTLPSTSQASVPRNYHSVALLMPDGRVWMAGSNIRADWSFHNSADYPPTSLPTDAQEGAVNNRELRIELFEPWYFGRSDRPTFNCSTEAVSVGDSFDVDTPTALTISRVAVVRAGSSTHSFNPDQRYVGLPFTRSGNRLVVSVPDNENLLPPGYYLLFVLNQVIDPTTGATLDVPSRGTFLRIDNAKPFKELKLEIKENLKYEIDLVKLRDDLVKLKDAEGDPFERLKDLIRPGELLGMLAQRLDNLARRQPTAQAFIKSRERPLIGPQPSPMPAALQRTPPPTAEELAMRDPHAHQGGHPQTRPEPDHNRHGPAAG
jgi:hypothetical protein